MLITGIGWAGLGWPDPYAQARFSTRQRDANHRNGARFVYTPQLLLEGADYRRGVFRDDIGDRIAALSQQKPGAHIRLTLTPAAEGAHLRADIAVPESASRNNAAIYIALYENTLASQVKAGENRGKQLLHDFVVRELWDRLPPGRRNAAASLSAYRCSPAGKPRICMLLHTCRIRRPAALCKHCHCLTVRASPWKPKKLNPENKASSAITATDFVYTGRHNSPA